MSKGASEVRRPDESKGYGRDPSYPVPTVTGADTGVVCRAVCVGQLGSSGDLSHGLGPDRTPKSVGPGMSGPYCGWTSNPRRVRDTPRGPTPPPTKDPPTPRARQG